MKISKKQLVSIFVCSLIPWTVGNGLLPLLPVYAERLGANAIMAGAYLAVTYLAIAIGAFFAGWISGTRLRRKIPIVLIILISSPPAWMIGRVDRLWALTLLTALLWFFAGMGLALISILTGLSIGEGERGKIFGILALASGLGSIIGGFGTGWLVKHWGYSAMFNSIAIFLLLGPFSALFLEEKEDKPSGGEQAPLPESKSLGRLYYLLFTASIIISIGGFVTVLLRSLSMNKLGFDPLEISSTVVIGGLISLPLPFLLGCLSDRIDRKWVLFFGYLLSIAGLLTLSVSRELWHFWMVSAIGGIAVGCNSAVGNALVTDLVPHPSLGKGLALFSATSWVGGVIGFALGGILLQSLDLVITCRIAASLGLVAVGLLIPIRVKQEGAEQTLRP